MPVGEKPRVLAFEQIDMRYMVMIRPRDGEYWIGVALSTVRGVPWFHIEMYKLDYGRADRDLNRLIVYGKLMRSR